MLLTPIDILFGILLICGRGIVEERGFILDFFPCFFDLLAALFDCVVTAVQYRVVDTAEYAPSIPNL